MKPTLNHPNRRQFGKAAFMTGATLAAQSTSSLLADDTQQRRIRTGVIGCGSVSHQYLPILTQSPFVDVVSFCDIRYERAEKQGKKFKVANTYPDIEAMLAGESFDFLPHGHDGRSETRHTISVVGSGGFMGMVGYDWAPLGVDLATKEALQLKRHEADAGGYLWQPGAALAAESLATGKDLLATPEHALHVLEIITAARESSSAGKRIALTSTFKWPVIT